MPYLSSSGTPAWTGPDAFTPPAQAKALVDAEAPWNYYTTRATTIDRDAIATPQLREGLLCYVEADDTIYRYNGSTWSVMATPRTFIQYTAAAAVTFPTTEAKITGMSTAVATDVSAFTVSSGTFTCVRAGRYRVDATAILAPTNGAASLRLYKNGTMLIEAAGFGSTNGNMSLRISETITFAAGDTFELRTVGAPLNGGTANAFGNRITITDA